MRRHPEEINSAIKLYHDDPDVQKMIIASDCTEIRGDRKWTRVEDTIDFARQMGYKKLGLATCHALLYEASVLTKILENKGFETVSVACKCGGIPKVSVGVPESVVAAQKDVEGFEGLAGRAMPSCNPVGQALIMNSEKTDFNIIVGLCVGHDTLFIKHSNAPVTVFLGKDRRLFHNPVGALSGINSTYFRYLLMPDTQSKGPA